MDKNSVFLDNHLCYYEANHNVQWKDLTAAEDVEREARFISLGYKLTYPDHEITYEENETIILSIYVPLVVIMDEKNNGSEYTTIVAKGSILSVLLLSPRRQ